MEWVEVTGKTVEDAKEAALDQLGVDETDAEFEVLEVPRSGLFGRLRAEARVRARVVPVVPRPKVDRRDRRRQGRRDQKGGTRRRSTSAETTNSERKEAPVSEQAEPIVDDDGPHESEVAESFLRGLVEVFGVEADIERREADDDTVELALTGPSLGLLIGKRGQTLASLQELTWTVVQRKARAGHGRVVVDVSGYRQARRQALEEFIRTVADEVRTSQVARVLEPMPPPDRKIVHDTVNELPGVATTSEGEEPRRRVVILPQPED